MPTRVLQSAAEQYRRHQRLVAVALAQAKRTWSSGRFSTFIGLLIVLQHEAAQNGIDSVAEMLAEQGTEAPLVAEPVAEAFMGQSSAGADLGTRVTTAVDTFADFEAMVLTELADAERAAQSVAIAARPTLTGYVRYLNPPSCSRCVILAGRFYKYSAGFERHPNCDCFHIPVDAGVNADLYWTDADEAVRQGMVSDLTVAELAAFNEGGDLSRIVNVKRKEAGLTVAGRVLERGGRPTPEGIYQLASDRDEVLRLLRQFGYLR